MISVATLQTFGMAPFGDVPFADAPKIEPQVVVILSMHSAPLSLRILKHLSVACFMLQNQQGSRSNFEVVCNAAVGKFVFFRPPSLQNCSLLVNSDSPFLTL